MSCKSRQKIPVWLGNAIEIFGLAYAVSLLLLINPKIHDFLKITLLIISWFCFWFFSHCLAHFIVGRIFGVKFLYYFIGPSSLAKLNLPFVSAVAKKFPVLGIKMEKSSFRRISRKRQAMVFTSGAIASMTLPSISVIYAALHFETWIAAFLSLITSGNIFFTLIFSAKAGDLYKARKSLYGFE